MTETILRTQAVTRRYGTFAAVADLSLEVEKGDIFALVGQNGAGKTTLLKLVCGLTPPTSGSGPGAGPAASSRRRGSSPICPRGRIWNTTASSAALRTAAASKRPCASSEWKRPGKRNSRIFRSG